MEPPAIETKRTQGTIYNETSNIPS